MSDRTNLFDGVVKNRRPLEPVPTDVVSELQRLRGVRAVIFDIYGTLVTSGSGDVGSADQSEQQSQIGEALAATGVFPSLEAIPPLKMLHGQIRLLNDGRRNETCPHPEVDIVEAWRQVLGRCQLELSDDAAGMVRLAAQYEGRANPTWPMPGASELLGRLKEVGFPMGIVSNAQVFTLPLVEDLLEGGSLSTGGFDLDLCFFSNRFRQSKPGPRLFDVLREALARRGIEPNEAVYVGNDMLNDVWTASHAGLRTAWFAGDARSCRRREDDPRCRSLRPDVVLTDLLQLVDCLEIK
jgi:putative hydrolase of the HAD superfamily